MNGFLGKLIGPQSTLPEAFLAASNDPNTSRMGFEQLESRRAAQNEHLEITKQVKLKLLQAHMEAAVNPQTPPEQLPAIQDNLLKIGASMGIDPSVFGNIEALRQPAQPQVKAVGGSLVKINPNQSVEELYRAPDRSQNRNVSLSPGSQLVGPDGTVLRENKNARFAQPRRTSTPRERESTLQVAENELANAESDLNANPNNESLKKKVARRRAYVEKLAGGVDRIRTEAGEGSFTQKFIQYEKTGSLTDLYNAASSAIDLDNTTNSDRAKRKGALRSKVQGVNTFRAVASRLEKVIEDDPTSITDAAKLAGLANNFMNEAKATMNIITRAFGAKVSAEKGLDPDRYLVMREIQGATREVKSMILTLGLASAAAQGFGSGRDLSNADLERALDQIGGGSRDPAVLLSGVGSAYQSMLDRLEQDAKVEAGIVEIDEAPIAPELSAPAPASKNQNIDDLVNKYRTK